MVVITKVGGDCYYHLNDVVNYCKYKIMYQTVAVAVDSQNKQKNQTTILDSVFIVVEIPWSHFYLIRYHQMQLS